MAKWWQKLKKLFSRGNRGSKVADRLQEKEFEKDGGMNDNPIYENPEAEYPQDQKFTYDVPNTQDMTDDIYTEVLTDAQRKARLEDWKKAELAKTPQVQNPDDSLPYDVPNTETLLRNSKTLEGLNAEPDVDAGLSAGMDVDGQKLSLQEINEMYSTVSRELPQEQQYITLEEMKHDPKQELYEVPPPPRSSSNTLPDDSNAPVLRPKKSNQVPHSDDIYGTTGPHYNNHNITSTTTDKPPPLPQHTDQTRQQLAQEVKDREARAVAEQKAKQMQEFLQEHPVPKGSAPQRSVKNRQKNTGKESSHTRV